MFHFCLGQVLSKFTARQYSLQLSSKRLHPDYSEILVLGTPLPSHPPAYMLLFSTCQGPQLLGTQEYLFVIIPVRKSVGLRQVSLKNYLSELTLQGENSIDNFQGPFRCWEPPRGVVLNRTPTPVQHYRKTSSIAGTFCFWSFELLQHFLTRKQIYLSFLQSKRNDVLMTTSCCTAR